MKVQTVKRALRIQEWATQISVCRKSGQTVRQWCNDNGINTKTFYNRMRVVREEMLELTESVNLNWMPDAVGAVIKKLPDKYGPINCSNTMQSEKPVFAALPMPQTKPAAVTVRMGGCAVEIHNSADNTIVEQVLRLMARL